MKILRNSAMLVAAILWLAAPTNAANINAGAAYTNDFTSQPAAADWSTRTLGGAGTAGNITTPDGLDAVVQTNTAAGITTQCASSTTSPPASASTAAWCTNGYLQTRPTGNAATLLLATFVNNTGSNATALHLNYDFVTNRASLVTEEVRGVRAYYSQTGAANSWSNIAAFSQTDQGTLSLDLTLPAPWTNGGKFYLLWADDNGSSTGADDANDFDNFYLAITGGASLPASCTLNTPANGQSFAAVATVALSASASAGEGATNTGVGFYDVTSGLLASTLTAPFTNTVNLSAGLYAIYAVATNSLGTTTFSATNNTTVTNTPFSVALTSPAHGQSFRAPTNVTLTASANAGTSNTLTGVGFYDVTNGFLGGALTPPFTNRVSLGAGVFAFYAVATNSLSEILFSATNTVTATNLPLAVVLNAPASAQSFAETVSLSATSTVTGGSAPYAYAVTFYTNAAGGPVGAVAAGGTFPTFTAALGTLTEGSYQIYAEATDGATTARSVTNTFTTAGPIKVAVGGVTMTFDTAPSAQKWSTYSLAGNSATAQSMAQMDAGMATNAAACITTALPTQSGSATNPLAYWRSSDQKLGTQPGSNRETLLMATLFNDTGVIVSRLEVAYTFGLASVTPSGTNKGHRVYYSTNGAANSWTAIGFLSLASVGSVTTNFSLTGLAWAPATKLYLVWLDENGTNPDGDYTIDNISFTPTLAVLNVAVTSPTSNQLFVSGTSISATASVASGTEPYFVRFYTNSGAGNPVFAQAGSAITTPPFVASLGSLPAGAYNIFAEVTDENGDGVTALSSTNTFTVADPLSINLTDPAHASSFDWSVNIGATSLVAGGTSPFTVRFYTNSVLAGVADGNSGGNYFKNLGTLFIDSHTVQAVVTDSRGWQATSEVHTITITGPVFVTLTPTDGAIYIYGSSVTLTAAVVGGTAPYAASFYTNEQVAAVVGPGASPFLLALGMLPVGTYTNRVIASDDASSVTLSTTNVLTVLPNPLAATLTSPANGQSFRSSQTVPITVSATVSAPLTISNVEFYVDDAIVGTDIVAPFATNQNGFAEGIHTVHAVATDSLGRRSSTTTNTIEVLNLPAGMIVGASGYTNNFAVRPDASEWSTRAFGSTGSGGSSEIASATALDAAVATNTASLITSQLGSSNASPPAAANLACWSTSGYVQTRPTQNAATLLMATLVNNTHSNTTAIRIIYDYTTNRASLLTEEVRGLRVYYSLSGAANSWSNIAALSQTDQGTLSADVTLSEVWSNGTTMYLLWADDNGSGGPGDDANDLDNFSVAVIGTAINNFFCALMSPTNGQPFGAPASVPLAALAIAGEGTTIAGVGFYEVASGMLGSAPASPYTNSFVLRAGSYSLYAVATNSLGETYFSATNTVTVTNVPLSVALTEPANGASFGNPASVTLRANAIAGTGADITGVGFFEVAAGWVGSVFAAPYTNNLALAEGTFSFYAVATNSLNAKVFSATNTVTVTNVPLSVALTSPANGSIFGMPATVSLAASATAGSSGAAISSVAFYMASNGNVTLLLTDDAAPYSLQVSDLVEGTYSFFAVVTNHLNATAISATNTVTLSTLVSGTVLRGPYLGSRGTSNITIRWRTLESSVGRIRFGFAPGNLPFFADDAASATNHSVTLTGLSPETKYYYSIGTTGGTIQSSSNYYFNTAPPIGSSRSTRVWFLSDYGNGGDSTQSAVRDVYLNYAATNGGAADIWLTGGDNEQSGFVGADAVYQTSVFNVYSNVMQNTPVFPTPGNHDGGSSSAYWSIYDVPTQGQAGGYPSGNAHYYSFDYGSIHFISLDAFNASTDVGGPMLMWLTNDLASTTQKWIIAYWHAPVYCKVFYDSDTSSQLVAMRQNIAPVLESYGVDLVLTGHSHSLQRTYLLNGHYGVAATLSETNKLNVGDGRPDGTGAYVKTGKAGAVYAVAPTGCGMTRSGTTTHPACFTTINNTAGSIVLDVNSNRLDFKMITSTGSVADYFTILKSTGEVAPPTLAAAPRVTNGVFAVAFQATPGLAYTLQSEDILNQTWQNRSNITAPPNGLIVIQAPVGGATNRYYRLIYPAQ